MKTAVTKVAVSYNVLCLRDISMHVAAIEMGKISIESGGAARDREGGW